METLSPENRPTLDLFMAKMVEAEIQYRNRKRTEMYLRTSRLRYNTVMEDVICSEERNLTRQTLQELADCDFIPRAQNLLIFLPVLWEGRPAFWDIVWSTTP